MSISLRADILAKKQTKRKLGLAAIAALSVALALIAIFTLSGWAEASLLHHGIQHVLIFLSGLGVGGSAITAYQTKGDNQNES